MASNRKKYGFEGDASDALSVIGTVAARLSEQAGREYTPWEIDHAIWKAERARV